MILPETGTDQKPTKLQSYLWLQTSHLPLLKVDVTGDGGKEVLQYFNRWRCWELLPDYKN